MRQLEALTTQSPRRELPPARWGFVLFAALVAFGCDTSGAAFTGWIEAAHGHPLGPLAMILAMVASGFVAAPLTLTMIPAMVVFGPAFGSLWTLIGATISAAVFFQLGSQGAAAARRVGAPRLLHHRLGRLLERNGVVAVALARFLPLAPYPIVNLALGSTRVRFRDFMVGNLLGLVPWVGLYAVAGDRLRDLIATPSAGGAAALVLAVSAVATMSVAAAYGVSRFLPSGPDGGSPPSR